MRPVVSIVGFLLLACVGAGCRRPERSHRDANRPAAHEGTSPSGRGHEYGHHERHDHDHHQDTAAASAATDSSTTHSAANAGASGVVKLPPGTTVEGVRRLEPEVVAAGIDHEMPAVAVRASGKLVVAWVQYDSSRKQEQVMIRRSAHVRDPLGPPSVVFSGTRAWHPRIAVDTRGRDHAWWLVWCGRLQAAARGDHRTSIWARRWVDTPHDSAESRVDSSSEDGSWGDIVQVTPSAQSATDRACDPDAVVDDEGVLHVVWEQTSGDGMQTRIAYRSVKSGNHSELQWSSIQTVSSGDLDRRPSIAQRNGAIVVAWDTLVPTRADAARQDPNYDVWLRVRRGEVWQPPIAVDTSEGIQAAPDVQAAPDDKVLVAYHTTKTNRPLVKMWAMRSVTLRDESVARERGRRAGKTADDNVRTLALRNPLEQAAPSGEMQGAEFAALRRLSSGAWVVLSRPSQGAYLQVIDAAGVSKAFDLTRYGWGARGIKMDAAVAPDGTLVVARRGRSEVLLERMEFPSNRSAWHATEGAPEHGATLNPMSSARGVRTRTVDRADVVYGDVHMHSALSDGTGPPDEVYARAWMSGADFAALTDHDYIVGSRMTPSEHAEVSWLTDWFDRRAGFVALHAYEWTTPSVPKGAGHRNVYFRGAAPEYVYGFKDGYADTHALQQALRGEEAFTAPHHTLWTGTDWAHADDTIQRHFEIVSAHGAFERVDGSPPIAPRGSMPGMSAVDGLLQGHVFGFLGGSDGHGLWWHHGVGRCLNPWRQGLTGVVLEKRMPRTRDGVWRAMYDRRTFATSGAKMFVDFNVSGVSMGRARAEALPAPLRVHVHARVSATERRWDRIELVRDGKVAHVFAALPAAEVRLQWTDADVPSGAHTYYVRAMERSASGHDDQGQDDALPTEGCDQRVQVAWASPVFVTVTR
jgi:hypothetical protein